MPTMTKAGYVPPQNDPKKKPKKVPGAKKKRRKKGIGAATVISLLIFLLCGLIGAGTIAVYTQTAPYKDAFLPGTMLLGYPLGGAGMAQALALLDQITHEDVETFSVELTWGDQSYVLSASDLSLAVDAEATLDPLWQRGREGGMIGRFMEMMQLKSEPMAAQPIVTYDMTFADELLGLIRQDIACEPQDAQVAYVPGSASPFVFTEETIGYSLSLTGAREQIERAAATVTPTVIELTPETLLPKVTQEDLAAALVLRSRVVMEIDAQEDAYANVALAAAAFDGARIEPGATLSFNETAGERTAQRGYLPAAEPAYGADARGTGGGVCQLSSALYQLALLGDLEIVERSKAAAPVDYCPMGQEAAVSDQGVDLKVRNATAWPLFLRARTYRDGDAAMLEVQLIGEPLPARYALETVIAETLLIEEPVYVRDHDGTYATYDDERVSVGEAQPGYRVEVARLTLDSEGKETAREAVASSQYDPVPPAIYVGVNRRE